MLLQGRFAKRPYRWNIEVVTMGTGCIIRVLGLLVREKQAWLFPSGVKG